MASEAEAGLVENASESIKQQEPLSDEETSNLLAAVGNSEAKALTLLLMKPGKVYTYQALHARFISAQGENPTWMVSPLLPFKYCSYTLAPIGLVAKEIVDEDSNTFGFMLTERGQKIGQPLAALLLHFSSRHPEFSLLDFFGQTSSNSAQSNEQAEKEYKKRSPATRLKILMELATSQLPIRQEDLARQIGERSVVGSHLASLSEAGIIEYSSIDKGQPYSFYSLKASHPSEPPDFYRNLKTATNWVYSTLLQQPNKDWTIDELIELYALDFEGANVHRSVIAGVLKHLRTSGYASVKKFSLGNQSEINLSPAQREVIVDLVSLIDAFQNQDEETIAEGTKLIDELLSNPEKIATLIQKYRERSPGANQKPQEEYFPVIMSFISANPGADANSIRDYLKEYGYRISIAQIYGLLRNLVSSEQISFTSEKGVKKYAENRT